METNEQQQWEQIKKWLKDNAIYISLAAIFGFGGSFGWNYWKESQYNYKINASEIYDQVIAVAKNKQLEEARALLTKLEKNYSDTAYPQLANLNFAKYAYEQNNIPATKEALNWILNNTEDEIFIQIATDRLARVLLSNNEPEKVQNLINDSIGRLSNQSALANLNMLLADSYVLLKQKDAALASYQIAKQNLSERSTLKELIDLKIKDISSL